MDNVRALPEGTRLEEYRIEGVLGAGGFGITYRATDAHLHKVVAIKEYLPTEFATRAQDSTVVPHSGADAADYAWGLTRFLDEARTLARFDHPNLNKVHRFFEANGTAYLVLEHVEGRTLSEVLRQQRTLPAAEVERLLADVLGGLAAVHAAGYVHRDLKPGNLMLRPDGSAVVLDFGAARQAVGQRSKMLTSILTPGYAPIEQYDTKAEDVGAWSDLYALGMVAYRCISGVADGELPDAVTRARNQRKGVGDLAPAATVGKRGYDAKLLEAIDWAIEVHEEERPQSVEAWRAQLPGGETPGEAPPLVKRLEEAKAGSTVQRRWLFAAVLILAIVVGSVLTGVPQLVSGRIVGWLEQETTYPLKIASNVDNPAISIEGAGAYREGMPVAAGEYRVRVGSPGYDEVEETVRVGWWNGSEFHVALQKIPEVPVTITTLPEDARVYFPERDVEYRPGLSLTAGAYRTEITKEGFQDIETRITVSPPNAEFHFDLSAIHHTLEVTTEPADAQVRLVGTTVNYRSGMELPQDRYRVNVSRQGYIPQDLTIELTNDSARHVALERACRTVQVPKTECRAVTRYRDETRWLLKTLSITGAGSDGESRSAACRDARRGAKRKAIDDVSDEIEVSLYYIDAEKILEDIEFDSCTCSRESQCNRSFINPYTGQRECAAEYSYYYCKVEMTYLVNLVRAGILDELGEFLDEPGDTDNFSESYTESVPYTDQVCEEITVDEQQCEPV